MTRALVILAALGVLVAGLAYWFADDQQRAEFKAGVMLAGKTVVPSPTAVYRTTVPPPDLAELVRAAGPPPLSGPCDPWNPGPAVISTKPCTVAPEAIERAHFPASDDQYVQNVWVTQQIGALTLRVEALEREVADLKRARDAGRTCNGDGITELRICW